MGGGGGGAVGVGVGIVRCAFVRCYTVIPPACRSNPSLTTNAPLAALRPQCSKHTPATHPQEKHIHTLSHTQIRTHSLSHTYTYKTHTQFIVSTLEGPPPPKPQAFLPSPSPLVEQQQQQQQPPSSSSPSATSTHMGASSSSGGGGGGGDPFATGSRDPRLTVTVRVCVWGGGGVPVCVGVCGGGLICV
jgi:hypothetical protein